MISSLSIWDDSYTLHNCSISTQWICDSDGSIHVKPYSPYNAEGNGVLLPNTRGKRMNT